MMMQMFFFVLGAMVIMVTQHKSTAPKLRSMLQKEINLWQRKFRTVRQKFERLSHRG